MKKVGKHTVLQILNGINFEQNCEFVNMKKLTKNVEYCGCI